MCAPTTKADAVFNNEDTEHPILTIRATGRFAS